MNQSPWGDGTEKRLLIAIVLSMVVLLATPYLYQKFFPAPPQRTPLAQAQKPAQVEQPPAEVEKHSIPSPQIAPTSARPKIIVIENSDLELRWNNAGAVLESVRLKNYFSRGEKKDAKGTKLPPQPLEMIPQQHPPTMPRLLAVRLNDADVEKLLARAVYEVQGASGGPIKAPAEVTFLYRKKDVQVIKKVKVPASGYQLELDSEVQLNGRSVPFSLFMGPGVGDLDPAFKDEFSTHKIAYYHSNAVTRLAADDLAEGPQQFEVPARWVALDAQYFSYVLLGPSDIRALRVKKSDFRQKDEQGKEQRISLLSADVRVEKGAKVSFFIGPKDREILQRVDPSLSQIIDYGWFAFLVWPLLMSLKFIYQYIHNYGWAIIILTFIINLVLFPLRYKQMVSMKKMADIQPKLRSIQDRYKRMKRDDPRRQQMNAEVMELYRQHGVNPLGGCLPLVIQMPFLFAFYQMLAVSIELRSAPFIWWINDLSKHDPFYVTPIVMGASMLVQQIMTPGSTADPTQRRMMMLLPVVFTVMFLGVSSGLALYFLFSNVFAMMFQFLVQKWDPHLAGSKAVAKK